MTAIRPHHAVAADEDGNPITQGRWEAVLADLDITKRSLSESVDKDEFWRQNDQLGKALHRVEEVEAYAEDLTRHASNLLHALSACEFNGLLGLRRELAEAMNRRTEIGTLSIDPDSVAGIARRSEGQLSESVLAVGTHFDKGPWHAEIAHPQNRNPGWSVGSDDFTHDVVLYLSGDFKDDAQQRAYAEWLAAVLTRGCHSQYSLPAGAWVEHGAGWVKVHALSSPEEVANLRSFLMTFTEVPNERK